MDENPLDFNFWPSFADMMLAIVFVLVLVLFVVVVVITAGTVNLSEVQESQRTIISALEEAYKTKKIEEGTDVFSLSIDDADIKDIWVYNQPTTQRLTFTSNILFPQNRHELNDRGRQVLKTVGLALKYELATISRIEIEGHADTVATRRYDSNLHLAAARAIEVFSFFRDSVGIDPVSNLMSVASFGEYKPVSRAETDSVYTSKMLNQANETLEQQDRNRRIELLLFYRH